MRNVLSAVADAYPGLPRIRIRRQVPFDFYSPAERNVILQVATWLLLDWPDRFLRFCREAKVRHSELIDQNFSLPYWFVEGVNPLSIKPVGPGPEERASMRGLLELAEGDEIRLDWFKPHMIQRLAHKPIHSLWGIDSLPVPRRWRAEEGIALSAFKVSRGRGAVPRYGLRLCGLSKVEQVMLFPKSWEYVDIEIGGAFHRFPLRETFWKKSNEFMGEPIANWLAQHGMLSWRAGHPPAFQLITLSPQRFRLVA
jgi:hypothetical protein